jgi:hypothetical protein
MSADYGISLNGIFAAECSLNQAAQRIAAANLPTPGESADTVFISDFAAELLAVNRAKTSVEANLKMISSRQSLDRETLNLFA